MRGEIPPGGCNHADREDFEENQQKVQEQAQADSELAAEKAALEDSETESSKAALKLAEDKLAAATSGEANEEQKIEELQTEEDKLRKESLQQKNVISEQKKTIIELKNETVTSEEALKNQIAKGAMQALAAEGETESWNKKVAIEVAKVQAEKDTSARNAAELNAERVKLQLLQGQLTDLKQDGNNLKDKLQDQKEMLEKANVKDIMVTALAAKRKELAGAWDGGAEAAADAQRGAFDNEMSRCTQQAQSLANEAALAAVIAHKRSGGAEEAEKAVAALAFESAKSTELERCKAEATAKAKQSAALAEENYKCEENTKALKSLKEGVQIAESESIRETEISVKMQLECETAEKKVLEATTLEQKSVNEGVSKSACKAAAVSAVSARTAEENLKSLRAELGVAVNDAQRACSQSAALELEKKFAMDKVQSEMLASICEGSKAEAESKRKEFDRADNITRGVIAPDLEIHNAKVERDCSRAAAIAAKLDESAAALKEKQVEMASAAANATLTNGQAGQRLAAMSPEEQANVQRLAAMSPEEQAKQLASGVKCSDKPGYENVCGNRKDLCTDERMGPLYREQCAGTCGGDCPKEPGVTTESDRTHGGGLESKGSDGEKPFKVRPDLAWKGPCADQEKFAGACEVAKYLCRDSRLGTLYSEECPKTCGVCKSLDGPIESHDSKTDKAVDCTDYLTGEICAKRVHLCNDEKIGLSLRSQCAKTCGVCEPKKFESPTEEVVEVPKEEIDSGMRAAEKAAREAALVKTKLQDVTADPELNALNDPALDASRKQVDELRREQQEAQSVADLHRTKELALKSSLRAYQKESDASAKQAAAAEAEAQVHAEKLKIEQEVVENRKRILYARIKSANAKKVVDVEIQAAKATQTAQEAMKAALDVSERANNEAKLVAQKMESLTKLHDAALVDARAAMETMKVNLDKLKEEEAIRQKAAHQSKIEAETLSIAAKTAKEELAKHENTTATMTSFQARIETEAAAKAVSDAKLEFEKAQSNKVKMSQESTAQANTNRDKMDEVTRAEEAKAIALETAIRDEKRAQNQLILNTKNTQPAIS